MSTTPTSDFTSQLESSLFGPLSKYEHITCGRRAGYNGQCTWGPSSTAAWDQYSDLTAPMLFVSPKHVEQPMSNLITSALNYTSSTEGVETAYTVSSSGLIKNDLTPGSTVPAGESLSKVEAEDQLAAKLLFSGLFTGKASLSETQKSEDAAMAWGIDHWTSNYLKPGYRAQLRQDLYNRMQTDTPKVLTDFWKEMSNYRDGGVGIVAERNNKTQQISYDISVKGMEEVGKIISQDMTPAQIDFISNAVKGSAGLGAIAYQGIADESIDVLKPSTPTGSSSSTGSGSKKKSSTSTGSSSSTGSGSKKTKSSESEYAQISTWLSGMYETGKSMMPYTTYVKSDGTYKLTPDANVGYINKKGKLVGKQQKSDEDEVDELPPLSGGAYSMWIIAKVAKQDVDLYQAQQAANKRVAAAQQGITSAVTSALGLMQTARTTLSSLKSDNSKAFVTDEGILANVAAGYLDNNNNAEVSKLAGAGEWESTQDVQSAYENQGSANLMGGGVTATAVGLTGGTSEENVQSEVAFIEQGVLDSGGKSSFSSIENQANAFESAYSYLDTAKNPSAPAGLSERNINALSWWNKLNPTGTTSQEISNTRAIEGAFKDEWKAVSELSSAALSYYKAATLPQSVVSAAATATSSAYGSKYALDQSVAGVRGTGSSLGTGTLADAFREEEQADSSFSDAASVIKVKSTESVTNYANMVKQTLSAIHKGESLENVEGYSATGGGTLAGFAAGGPAGAGISALAGVFTTLYSNAGRSQNAYNLKKETQTAYNKMSKADQEIMRGILPWVDKPLLSKASRANPITSGIMGGATWGQTPDLLSMGASASTAKPGSKAPVGAKTAPSPKVASTSATKTTATQPYVITDTPASKPRLKLAGRPGSAATKSTPASSNTVVSAAKVALKQSAKS